MNLIAFVLLAAGLGFGAGWTVHGWHSDSIALDAQHNAQTLSADQRTGSDAVMSNYVEVSNENQSRLPAVLSDIGRLCNAAGDPSTVPAATAGAHDPARTAGADETALTRDYARAVACTDRLTALQGWLLVNGVTR